MGAELLAAPTAALAATPYAATATNVIGLAGTARSFLRSLRTWESPTAVGPDWAEILFSMGVGVGAGTPAAAFIGKFGVMNEDEATIMKRYEQRYKKFVAAEVEGLCPLSLTERLVLEELDKSKSYSIDDLWHAVGCRNVRPFSDQKMVDEAAKRLNGIGDIVKTDGKLGKLQKDRG